MVVDAGDGWVPYADRLSVALVEMVLSEAMFSAHERHVDNRELDDTANALVSAAFECLPLPAFPFWAGMDGPGVRWFARPDVLLRNDGGTSFDGATFGGGQVSFKKADLDYPPKFDQWPDGRPTEGLHLPHE
ncbi:hypothetical protein TPA0907_61790 [Micromonospora humidisoli]|nr:hypothetical protein TPA0907_61790 [Micromonospora sp. AKA109]